MGHYCGAHNRTIGGNCGRWLVNFDHCADHRRAPYATGGPEAGGSVDHQPSVDSADVLSEMLTDGLVAALGDLVVDYVGSGTKRQLRRRRARTANCQEIADAAKAVLDLKDKAHELTGQGVASLLPSSTPRLARSLTANMAQKLPLPWDAKLEAIARGLQATGIFLCVVRLLPPEACPCLGMIANEMTDEAIKQAVTGLINQGRRDLRTSHSTAA
jgi:hypothetical protein